MTEKTDLNALPAHEHAPQSTQPQDPYAEVSLPENSSLSAADLDAFKQAALQVNLPAQTLQAWLHLEETRLQTAAQAAQETRRTQQAQWASQTQALFGPAWQEEVSKAVRAADAFGGPELRQLLEETGLGNHPVMVRTFHAVAKRVSEDVTPGGAPGVTADKTFTQALYGKN